MLQNYINDTQALLHDTSGLFTPVSQLTRWINQARRQVAYRTACLRVLVAGNAAWGSGAEPGVLTPGAALPNQSQGGNAAYPTFTTIANVERYPFAYANPIIAQQDSGIKGIVDVFSVAVSWGGARPALSWLPWDELQAYGRSFNFGITSYPFYWSTYGDGENGEVWLFPIPTQNLEMEWDTTCVPSELTDDDAKEPLPEAFRPAVKYYAAHLAYVGSQRPSYSQMMLQMFQEILGIGRVASDRGKVRNYYW